jgi:hypothetical protein
MRIAQIFDQQLLEMDRLEVVRQRDVTVMSVEVDCNEYLARRIHAKLYRTSDVVHVVLANANDEVIGEGEIPNPSAPSEFDPLTPQP